MKFLLWCVLLVLCWPLALFAVILYPIIWILLLPFRLFGIAVHGVLIPGRRFDHASCARFAGRITRKQRTALLHARPTSESHAFIELA